MGIIGHWTSLTEVQKLTQSKLLAGIVQEVYEQGQILQRLPVTGITGTSLKWNREKTLPTADRYAIGDAIPWKADVDYEAQVEFTLKTFIRQDPLDKFIAQNYPTINDYRAAMLMQLGKGCMRTIEDALIYDDTAVDAKQIHGLHSLVSTASTMYTDAGEAALSLMALKRLLYKVKPKAQLLLMAPVLADRFDMMSFAGITSGATNIFLGGSMISRGVDPFGQPCTTFDGVPILKSDYMVAEQANTGIYSTGANARAKHTSGTAQYSILAMRFGQIEDGGVCLLLGAGTGGPTFFDHTHFDKLEDYNAEGERLVAYCELANGSTKALACYFDTTDAAFTL